MPQRKALTAVLWFALAALVILLALLTGLSGAGAALAVGLLLFVLLTAAALLLRRLPAPAPPRDDLLLARINHEMRTPLNTIMGTTQLALQTPLNAQQRELLGKADAASRTLLGLVNDVADVAALEAGRVQLDNAPLRLEDVVGQALELVRPLRAQSRAALVCEWADADLLGARGQLRGDAPRLRQVLVQLLSHALQFAPGRPVHLRLSGAATDARGRMQLVMAVHDGGAHHGADPADSSLALSTARRLVELMGGELQAQPRAGTSQGFELRLPLPPSDTLPPALPRPRRLLLAEAAGDSRAATLNLLRHLGQRDTLTVCDDVATLLLALDEARASASAAEWLLLDWHLPGPGPSGAELLARLRREHPALRIAVLGEPAQGEGLEQARAFGARAVCDKPLQPGELRRLLDDAPAPAPAAVDGESLTGLRVLLVEDHPVNQDIAVRLLSSRGALVDVAANGQLGLDQLRARGADAYDLVLMDLRMPVLDGLEATRRLRTMPGFESLPVLAMTAHALAEERAQCLVAGMQGHIAKPLDVAHLVRELQRYRQPGTLGDGPALDLTAGLRQFSGQAALYQRTMRGFADQYADGLAGWVDWLRRGEWSELRRAAHTLQGLAATLGAQPLHRAALALERCAATGDVAGAGHLLGRVEMGLLTVRNEIRSALPPRDEPRSAPAAGAAPADLAELRLLLSQSDSGALDWWETHGPHSGLDAATTRRLDEALAVLDFDRAARVLGDAG